MASKKPDKAILFLYEGDSELGFYDTLFEKLGLHRNAQIKKKCLNGRINLNRIVADKIYQYLDNSKNNHVKYLHVVVAYDREAPRDAEGHMEKLDITLIINEIDDKRLRKIYPIIATQMLESWFFIDIQGIYNYLKMPASKQNPHKYKDIEKFRHEHLNELFKQAHKDNRYYKGITVKEFVKHLDVEKIYRECKDLKDGIDFIFNTAGIKRK